MRFSVVAVALLVLGGATVARAQDVNVAKEHFRKGTAFFDMGNYAAAAQEYSLAFEAKDDPALLFNIAQAHRLAGNNVEALRAYKGFLRRVPQTSARAEVEARIRDLQELVDRQHAAQQSPPTGVMTETKPPPAGTAPAPATTTAPAALPAAATPVATTTTASETRRTPVYKKWWLWTAVAGGVVAVGLGVGLGLGLSGDHFNPSLGKIGPGALNVVSQ
jgi:tetratricopeptide (TPR) repeat protein